MEKSQKNVNFLMEKYPYLNIKENKKINNKFVLEKAKTKEIIVKVKDDKGDFYLNSKYEPYVAAQIWAEQFENVTYKTKFVIIGFANGVYLKVLKEKYPENIIICSEAFEELEQIIINNVDITEDFGDKVFFAAGERRRELFQQYISQFIAYGDRNDVIFGIIPNYAKIDEQYVSEFKNIYYHEMERLIVVRNTLIGDEKYRRDSILKNLFVFPKKNTLGQLIANLKKHDFSNNVAIIVSAGPSLDKNIDLLKKAKNKAFLIAVDASAMAMIKVGVCPDIIVTIDPIKDETILQNEQLLKTPLICSMYSHYRIVQQHKGNIYFQTSDSEFAMEVYKKYNHEMVSLSSGGSVANNAYSLAEVAGFGTIVLVGQDLAYPNGQVHASGAEYKLLMGTNTINAKDKRYFEVEANDGGKVLTEGNMDIYRRWFEERIREGKCHVINATEGGARIEGAEIQTLKEVVDKYCQDKKKINYGEIVRVDVPAFTQKEQNEIYASYFEIENELRKWEKKLSNGIRRYERLRKLNRSGKYHTSEYQKIVEENGILTKSFEKSREVYLLKEWGNKEEYEALDTIVQKTDSLYEEVENLIKAGILTYETYMKNCKLLEKEWQILLKENGVNDN